MHEFSIAVSIVETATEYAEKANANKINEIEIEIGELSGVIYDALEFALESAVKDTILSESIRKLIRVEGIAKCKNCNNEFKTSNMFDPCPKCGTFNPTIIKGKELKLKSIIVD